MKISGQTANDISRGYISWRMTFISAKDNEKAGKSAVTAGTVIRKISQEEPNNVNTI